MQPVYALSRAAADYLFGAFVSYNATFGLGIACGERPPGWNVGFDAHRVTAAI
jgi:hypothetical protein